MHVMYNELRLELYVQISIIVSKHFLQINIMLFTIIWKNIKKLK